MTTGFIAAFAALTVLAFEEIFRRSYPSKRTWMRLRNLRGRLAVRLMRERFERMAEQKAPRRLAELLVCLMIVWVAAASLLDKRWHEVVTDVLPYVFVALALLRTPGALRAAAGRMKEYERELGEDPDEDWRDWGLEPPPTELAL